MSKVIGFVIGAALIVAGIFFGPQLMIAGALMIVNNAVLLLTMPKQPARQASEMSIQLGEQPRVMLVGETFTAGSLVDGFNYGGKYGTDHEVLIIRLADHVCEGLTGFYVNDEYVPYTHDGNYPQFDTHHFSLWFRADTTNDPLPDVVLDNGPGWTAADIGQSGCDVIVDYLADAPDAEHPAWPGGRPRFGFVVKGKKCYDPRLDDTVTGGSGPHRFDDPSTWEWSENCVICWYNFERGTFADDDTADLTKLLVGRGLSAEESPPENIFAAANLCDEIQGAVYPYRLLNLTPPLSTSGAFFSPDFTLMLFIGVSAGFEIWDVRTLSKIGGADVPTGGHVAVNSDGSFYASAYMDTYSVLVSANGTVTTIGGALRGGIWNTNEGLFGRSSLVDDSIYSPGGTGTSVTSTHVGFYPSWFFDDLDGTTIAIGGTTVGSGITSYATGFSMCEVTAGPAAGTVHNISASTSGAAYALDNGNGQYFVWQDDQLYLIDKATFAIDAGPVSAVAFSGSDDAPFRGVSQGASSIWIGPNRYSTAGLSLVETVTFADWNTGTGGGGSPIYDPINDAIWGMNPTTDLGVVTVRYLHRNGGYRVAGPIYSNQEFLEVEEMFAAACAGSILTHEGQVLLEPGQAKSVVATFTDDDLLTGSSVNWNQGILSESSEEWINTVVARYVEPDQKWNDHAAPVVRDTDDIITDGKPREASITLRLVRYQGQALRIAEVARRMGRVWGRATVKLGPRFCEIEEGDWINWQSDRRFGGATKTFRVEAYGIDEKWQITLTLREITATVFAADGVFDQDQSVPITTPPPPDIGAPDAGNWTLSAVTLDSAGASIPALEITGSTSDDPYVETIVIEYWKDDGVTDPTADPDAVPWITEGTHPPSTTLVDITTVTGGATYYAAVTYIVSGQSGDRLVLGPVTLTDFGATPFYEEEDDATPMHAEDGATLIHLG